MLNIGANNNFSHFCFQSSFPVQYFFFFNPLKVVIFILGKNKLSSNFKCNISLENLLSALKRSWFTVVYFQYLSESLFAYTLLKNYDSMQKNYFASSHFSKILKSINYLLKRLMFRRKYFLKNGLLENCLKIHIFLYKYNTLVLVNRVFPVAIRFKLPAYF